MLIRKHERGLRFRKDDFIAPLEPGQYTLFVPPWDADFEKIEAVDTLKTRFDHPLLEVLLADTELREHLVVAELTDAQRGVVYRDGRPYQLIGPGKHAYWNAPARVEIEVFEVGSRRFNHPDLAQIAALPHAGLFLETESDANGLHAFWRGTGDVVSTNVVAGRSPAMSQSF